MGQLVLVLIAVNVLISWKGLNDNSFFEKYKFQIGPIAHGEKIRMLSSGFLHVDYMHLGFNMYALYIFADVVMYRMGAVAFLVLYFGSLFAGSLLSYVYNKGNSYYSAVGASGAVSGVVYSAIMFNPDMNLNFILFPFIDIPGYVFGVGYLLYSIYGMKKQLGNIGHSAHLGGAIGGFVCTLVLAPEILQENTFMVILLAVPIVLLLVFEKKFQK
ncbi:rhomboid family intramembrane serine protease [Flavicella sediminum]|uniref:rhomboid family intramembrane serine protease n=1 Tax=Flavicella sediminum TaxID=2585141 RepID=UPI001121A286|nr:rhomboid family intramembrane serine protease [Flavicella sediminum]